MSLKQKKQFKLPYFNLQRMNTTFLMSTENFDKSIMFAYYAISIKV